MSRGAAFHWSPDSYQIKGEIYTYIPPTPHKAIEENILHGAEEEAKQADLMLSLGTTMRVTPACDLVLMGREPLQCCSHTVTCVGNLRVGSIGHFHTWTIKVPVNRGSENRGSPIPHPHIEIGERCTLPKPKHWCVLFGLGHWTGLLVTGLPAGLTCSWLAVVVDLKGIKFRGREILIQIDQF